ncbi:MAG: glycosyltransferase family 39 protein [Chloroflexi bacterium]|nr:glycosyltransferase family 39 protein [Chloroflexota bacterium]
MTTSWLGRALDRHWLIYLVVCATFALHLGMLSVFPRIPVELDQGVFVKQGKRLAQQGLVEWKYNARAPGYIFFVATNFLVSGEDRLGFVRVAQSALAATTAAALYGLTQLAFTSIARRRRQVIGLLAALVYAVTPDYLFFSQTVWAEAYFIFLLVLAFCFLLRAFRQEKRWYWFLASGVLFGAATLTREFLILFAAGFVPLWLVLTHLPQWRAGVARALVFLLGVILVIAPYTYRNYVNLQAFELISWEGGHTFWMDTALALTPGTTKRALRPGLRKLDPATRNRELYARGFELVLAQPVTWVLVKANEPAKIWTDLESNLFVYGAALKLIVPQGAELWRVGLRVFWLVLLDLIIIGVVLAQDSRAKLLWAFYLLASIAAYFATHYQTRFRLPLAILFLPYAAYSAVELVRMLRTPGALATLDRKRILVAACVLLLVNWQALPVVAAA